jgi:hypothetical protein
MHNKINNNRSTVPMSFLNEKHPLFLKFNTEKTQNTTV